MRTIRKLLQKPESIDTAGHILRRRGCSPKLGGDVAKARNAEWDGH